MKTVYGLLMRHKVLDSFLQDFSRVSKYRGKVMLSRTLATKVMLKNVQIQ